MDESKPINCRQAMLELHVDHDGMAKLLGVSRNSVVSMCLNGEDVPRGLEQRIRVLTNTHRSYGIKKPIMEIVRETLWDLHKWGGKAHVEKLPLSSPQIKNIEQIEGWMTIVWEPVGQTGRHPYVYLTAAGYIELGIIMPSDAAAPSSEARRMTIKGLNDFDQLFVEAMTKQIDQLLKLADDIKTMRAMVLTGVSTGRAIQPIYEALTNGGGAEPLKVTHDQSQQET